MKSKLLLVSFTLTMTLAIAFTGSVFADEPYDKAPPARVLKIALNLDDEQVVALRDLIGDRSTEAGAIRDQVTELQAQLDDLLISDAPDPAEVGGLVLDIRGLKQDIKQVFKNYQQSFRELLTPMQLERLARINRIAVAERAAEVLRELRLR